jgi:hypothetical protein
MATPGTLVPWPDRRTAIGICADCQRDADFQIGSPRPGHCTSMRRLRRESTWGAGLLCCLPVVFLCCATTKPEAGGSAVFGGKGAMVKELPLPTGSKPEAGGPCAGGTPPSDTALIDDFEDGDAKPFKGYQREAWWFTVSDKTPGSVLSPDGTFKPAALPAAEASRDNAFAAHVTASGQTEWGMTFSTTLRWSNEGVHCPLNVSAFRGIKFRAKGPGTIQLKVEVPGTTPPDYGGECSKNCYDSPGKLIRLSDHWEEYQARWEQLQQGGWGAEVRFDPARVLGLAFAVGVAALPADFWVDDVALLPKATAP